jgi:hypothetical protein
LPRARTVKRPSGERLDPEKTRRNSAGFIRRAERGRRSSPVPLVSPAGSPKDSLGGAGALFGIRVNSSGYQASPTLGAARSEHLATVPGGHAGAEAMGASTLDAAGLKGSFHRSKLLLKSGRIEAQVKRALVCFPYPQKRSQSICFAG